MMQYTGQLFGRIGARKYFPLKMHSDEVDEAVEQAKHFDFLARHKAAVWYDRDGSCCVFIRRNKGYPVQPKRKTLKEAVNAAMEEIEK